MPQTSKDPRSAGIDIESDLSSFTTSQLHNGRASGHKSARILDIDSFPSSSSMDQPRTSVLHSLLVVTVLVSTLVFLFVCLVVPLFNAINHPIGELKTMDSKAGKHSHDTPVGCPGLQSGDNHDVGGSNHQQHDMDSSMSGQQHDGDDNSKKVSSSSNGFTTTVLPDKTKVVSSNASKISENQRIPANSTSMQSPGDSKMKRLGDNSEAETEERMTTDQIQQIFHDYQLFMKYSAEKCRCSSDEFDHFTGNIGLMLAGLSPSLRTCLYQCMDSCGFRTGIQPTKASTFRNSNETTLIL